MIYGTKIFLRPMESEDMEYYKEIFNSESISQMVVGWGFPISLSEQNTWFEKAKSDNRNRRFTIVDIDTNTVLGMISISSIDWQNRKATIGIKLRESCPKRKGYATDALTTLTKYAFYEMNLHRLEASWITYNEASKNLYKKCGWIIEGVRKEAIYRSGQYHDLEIAGMLREQFDELFGKKI